jgi:hypothetical protein
MLYQLNVHDEIIQVSTNRLWKIYGMSSFFSAPARNLNVRFGTKSVLYDGGTNNFYGKELSWQWDGKRGECSAGYG